MSYGRVSSPLPDPRERVFGIPGTVQSARDVRVVEEWVQTAPDRWARHGAIWLSTIVGLSMALSVVWIWDTIKHRAHEHIVAATEFTARIDEALIVQDLAHRLSALDRLVRQVSRADGPEQQDWESDARHYIRDMPGVESILLVDASLNTRTLISAMDDTTHATSDPGNWHPPQDAISAARRGREVVLTPPFELDSNRPKIAAIYPIMSGDRFGGVIVSITDLETWLSSVVTDAQDADHQVRIALDDREVFRYSSEAGSPDVSQTYRNAFVTHGLIWALSITPTSSLLSAGHGDSSALVLIVGLLFSLLAATVVYLASKAHAQSRRFQDIATRLSTLFGNLPGVAYRGRAAPGRPMEFVSAGCLALCGYSRSEFDQQCVGWDDLIVPEDRDRIDSELRLAVASKAPYEFIYRIRTKQGDERCVWERGRSENSASGGDAHIEGFISDITARRQAEQAVIDAREFSEAVLETAAEAVITVDSAGRIEKFNRAAQQMFGYSYDDVHGENISLLMPEKFAAQHDGFIARFVETGVSRIIGTGRELNAKRSDGSVFPIVLSVSEVRDQSQQKFVGILRDISEQRAAENEARKYRENLAHVDRLNMLGEMATGIAHEINQPLTAISLFVQAGSRLLDAQRLGRLPEIFDKLDQHAHRASAVIERMQAMARRRESDKEVTDCNTLLKDVARLAEAEARFRDMTIEIDVAEFLPPVQVDVIQIQQVVLNLVRNAMEATQSVECRNGSRIVLRTALDGEGDVEVSVIDRGCGVSEQVAELLFTPFSTTKTSGMGLGLSICRAIVVAHGGQLDFRNNEFGGATFLFTLHPADAE